MVRLTTAARSVAIHDPVKRRKVRVTPDKLSQEAADLTAQVRSLEETCDRDGLRVAFDADDEHVMGGVDQCELLQLDCAKARLRPVEAGSARLLVASRLPEDVDMTDGWLDSPVDAPWSSMMREVTLPVIANADMYRIAFASVG